MYTNIHEQTQKHTVQPVGAKILRTVPHTEHVSRCMTQLRSERIGRVNGVETPKLGSGVTY